VLALVKRLIIVSVDGRSDWLLLSQNQGRVNQPAAQSTPTPSVSRIRVSALCTLAMANWPIGLQPNTATVWPSFVPANVPRIVQIGPADVADAVPHNCFHRSLQFVKLAALAVTVRHAHLNRFGAVVSGLRVRVFSHLCWSDLRLNVTASSEGLNIAR